MDHRPLLGTSGEPSIGAVAAANVSGPRRIHSGAARDSLIGVRFVNGRGEVVKNGGRVMKNVTGLDLVKLQAGAFGTLGVLTEVIFKVVPAYEAGGTLLLEGLDTAGAVATLSAALGSPYEVTGAAYLPAGIGKPARALIRVEGFESSVVYRLDALRKLVAGAAPAAILRGEDHVALWRAVRDAAPLVAPRDEAVWRISVAPSKAPRVMAAIGEVIGACRALHDWGGGLIWIALPAAGDAGAGPIRAAVAAVGGHATLVRADEGLRARIDVFTPPAPALAPIVAGIKASFDPDRILNPGLMHAGT